MPIWMRFVLFFGVALSIVGGVHYYLWTRLVRDPSLPAGWSRALTALIVALALSIPATLISWRLLGREIPGLSWVAFTWMGVFFLFFVLTLGADLAFSVGELGRRLTGGGPLDPERRLFLARALAGTVGLLGLASGGAAVASALGRVRVRKVEIALAKLPAALDGFTIAQINDVHLGPTIGRAFMAEVVREINALGVSLVAVVGDLVDGGVEELGQAAAPLGDLKSKHGTYFVTGNHEYYSGADDWIAHLRSLNVRVLRNERVQVGEGEHHFELAGTDDHMAHGFPGHGEDLDRALAGRDPSRALVLLAHQPKTFREASQRGVDLQLSGHTHGGQIWPFGYLVRLQQGFLAGLERVGEAQIYTSRGTGYWGPPMRLFAPAEITHITLRAARG